MRSRRKKQRRGVELRHRPGQPPDAASPGRDRQRVDHLIEQLAADIVDRQIDAFALR